MFYLTDYLPIQEIFHPDYFKYFKDHTSWNEGKINRHLATWVPGYFLETFRELRKVFGPMYINNWHAGGDIKNAGKRLRIFQRAGIVYGEQVGAAMSSHYGSNGTADFHCNAEPQEVFGYIMENPEDFPHIYRMEHFEITPTWNHIETCSKRPTPRIKVFKP